MFFNIKTPIVMFMRISSYSQSMHFFLQHTPYDRIALTYHCLALESVHIALKSNTTACIFIDSYSSFIPQHSKQYGLYSLLNVFIKKKMSVYIAEQCYNLDFNHFTLKFMELSFVLRGFVQSHSIIYYTIKPYISISNRKQSHNIA